MKRFYKEVSLHQGPQGWGVMLDNKPLKTPAQKEIWVPYKMAEILMQEWQAQDKTIQPSAMPFTQWVCTALDRTSAHREDIIRHLLRFIDTDTVRCWADHPRPLVARQEALWQPLISWMQERFNVSLPPVTGLNPLPQPSAVKQPLEKFLQTLNDLVLTVVADVVEITGSLVIGLALLEKHLTAEQAFDAACLEALYQAELWGEDDDAKKRQDQDKTTLTSAQLFLTLMNEKAS